MEFVINIVLSYVGGAFAIFLGFYQIWKSRKKKKYKEHYVFLVWSSGLLLIIYGLIIIVTKIFGYI